MANMGHTGQEGQLCMLRILLLTAEDIRLSVGFYSALFRTNWN
jgi:hypothetical protein